jgi:3-polyprenyl-4-hydroxybenzoate decarboxylase
MAYYRDVREYLSALEAAGKLIRIKQPINKDTEMHGDRLLCRQSRHLCAGNAV